MQIYTQVDGGRQISKELSNNAEGGGSLEADVLKCS